MSSASWNGSDLIYNKLIRPFVLKHQKKIDEVIDTAADKFKDGRFELVFPVKVPFFQQNVLIFF